MADILTHSDTELPEDGVPTGAIALTEEEMQMIASIAVEAAAAAAEERNQVFENVAKTIEGKLTSRMGFRKDKENQWLEAMRLYLGSLSSYNLVSSEYPLGIPEGKRNASSPETNIVRVKCETAISQTMAYQFAGGDKNWDLRAPQVLDIDQSDMEMIQQMAGPDAPPMSPDDVMNYKIDLMEAEMELHLDNCQYGPETRLSAFDWAVLGTGVMKGPTNSTKIKKVYQKTQTSDGQIIRVPKIVQENVPSVYRVNPWYWFPDDSVTEVGQAEDSIEIHPWSKTQLRELLKNPAFIPEQVQKCLDEEPKTYTNSPFNDPAYLTSGVNLLKGRYVIWEYNGPLKRSELESMGKAPVIESDDEEYFVEVWGTNSRIIRLEFSNLEGCYRIPYTAIAWERDPSSIFGFGIPMLVRDQQKVVNEVFKMMIDNAGISAGPQVIVDTTLIRPAEGGLECTPWKVWYANEYGADVSNAIKFFMPQNAFEGLSALFTMSMGLADQESSIPNLSLSLGAPTGGGDSATGMAIAQANAASPLFYKSEQWDDQMTKPLIEMLYDWEMQYSLKDEIKATYDIDVKTSTSRLQTGMQQQDLKALMMEIAQGSPIGEWVEMDDLAITRLSTMHLPSKGLIKSPQKVAQERAQRPPPPPDPNMLKAQAEMAKVENEKGRIALAQKQQDIDANQKHQEAIMNYQAQMRTDDVRAQEAQASVIKSQYDYNAQMAGLASKDEQHRSSIIASMNSDVLKDQTTKFLGGAKIAMEAQGHKLYQRELDIKEKTGSGI